MKKYFFPPFTETVIKTESAQCVILTTWKAPCMQLPKQASISTIKEKILFGVDFGYFWLLAACTFFEIKLICFLIHRVAAHACLYHSRDTSYMCRYHYIHPPGISCELEERRRSRAAIHPQH